MNDSSFLPERLGKVIHIAGTNGKGTVSHTLYQILRKNDFNVNLFTSPHIFSITERIIRNDSAISMEEFDDYFEKYKKIIEKYSLTYFEAVTFLAFKFFESEFSDYTILETGMGGRFDATNVIDEKIPVITSVSLDHERFLGNRLEKIVLEKAGIIKENKILFLGRNDRVVFETIKSFYPDLEIKSLSPEKLLIYKEIYPEPYYENIALACEVLDYLSVENCEKIELPPCRFEKIGNFILDGAHNFNAIYRLMKNFDHLKVILYTSTKDRDYGKIIKFLLQKCENLIITELPDNLRSIDVNEITIKNERLLKIKNLKDALLKAVELSKNSDILVCGSLYLCAAVKKILE